jgi:hypothetical protein
VQPTKTFTPTPTLTPTVKVSATAAPRFYWHYLPLIHNGDQPTVPYSRN